MNAGEYALSSARLQAYAAIDAAIREGDFGKAVTVAATAQTGGYWPDEITSQLRDFAEYAARRIAEKAATTQPPPTS